MIIDSKKIIVTGGGGFLGKHLIKILKKRGISTENIFVPRSKQYDLRKVQNVEKMFDKFPADIVIHLATTPGGIGYYKKHPGKVFYDNAVMGINVIDIACQRKVEKMVIVGSALGYPKDAPIPYSEKDFWQGYPGEVEAPYGIANKILSVQASTYKKEYGFEIIYVILPNLYGPGDHFDENAHVIPSMIKKFEDAKKRKDSRVELWGDGSASREFLFVEDAAKLLVSILSLYDSSEPLNLGPGIEITIKELANKIKKIVNYNGEIFWDISKPSGIPRRALNCTKAKKFIKFVPKIEFDEGLAITIEWFKYKTNKLLV